MCTATECDLWREALDVLRHVSDAQRGMLGDIAAAQDDNVLAGLVKARPVLSSIVDAATQRGLWPELLTLLPLLPAASRRRVAALGTGFGRSILAQIVHAAHEECLWAPLLGFIVELEVSTQRDAAKLIRAGDDEMLEWLLDAIEQDGLEEEFGVLTGRLAAADMRVLEKGMAALDA